MWPWKARNATRCTRYLVPLYRTTIGGPSVVMLRLCGDSHTLTVAMMSHGIRREHWLARPVSMAEGGGLGRGEVCIGTRETRGVQNLLHRSLDILLGEEMD